MSDNLPSVKLRKDRMFDHCNLEPPVLMSLRNIDVLFHQLIPFDSHAKLLSQNQLFNFLTF